VIGRVKEFLLREHRRKSLNYDSAIRLLRDSKARSAAWDRIRIHKQNKPEALPKVSIVLLDWSCRERFDPLDWLEKQNVPRDQYELIWVELFDRLVPEAMEHADVVVTCHQPPRYNKHEGYNVGLLLARSELFCVCDSDAVFPQEFVKSILDHFYGQEDVPRQSVLFHYEARSSLRFPGLKTAEQLKESNWLWWGLHPNVGACMTVRTADAFRFGGFDEDPAYAGYLCGPYELGWRLMNAGLPEVWHDQGTLLWHFAHPDPVGDNGILPSLRQVREIVYPHVDLHALHAVEALACGRTMPLQENSGVFSRRMMSRVFGTDFVARYAFNSTPQEFPKSAIRKMRRTNQLELLRIEFSRLAVQVTLTFCRLVAHGIAERWEQLRDRKPAVPVYTIAGWMICIQGEKIFAVPRYVDPNKANAYAKRTSRHHFWAVRSAVLHERPAFCAKPEIVYEDVKGFAIVVFLDIAFGIPAAQIPFDFGQQLEHGTVTYWGKTVAEVCEMIEQRGSPTAAGNRQRTFLDTLGRILSGFPGILPNEVVFLAGIHNINLVYFDGKILAIPKAIGHVNFLDPESRQHNGIRAVSTCAELREMLEHEFGVQGLDWVPAHGPDLYLRPQVIDAEVGNKSYKLVGFLTAIIAVPCGEETFDLGRLLLNSSLCTYWGNTIEEVKQMAAAQMPSSAQERRATFLQALGDLLDDPFRVQSAAPIFVATLRDRNLVFFANELLVIPHFLGKVDLFDPNRCNDPHIERVTNRLQLVKIVDAYLALST
jgi:hypothetical protein